MSTAECAALPPFAGVRVLDLTQNAVGQCVSSAMGDLGADVVSITRPGYAQRRKFSRQQAVGRSKRSVCLDLKSGPGAEVFQRLCRSTDVLLEGYRPGVARRLGVDYDSVREWRPDVIYCSLSGYGQQGPYRDLPGHDLNYQGVAGAILRSSSGEPVMPTSNWADRCSTLDAQFAIAAGLYGRTVSGRGCFIDVSITDSVLMLPRRESWGHPTIERVLNGGPPGSESPPTGILQGRYPAYSFYECADGSFLTLGCVEPWFWTRFCDYIGRPDWAGEQEPEPQRAQEMFAELRALFRERPRSQWLSELAGQDLPVAPINWDDDVLADAHLRERGSIVHLADVAGAPMHQLALPFKITGAPTAIDRPTRRVGEDTREILTELGYSSAAVQELVSAGVVAD